MKKKSQVKQHLAVCPILNHSLFQVWKQHRSQISGGISQILLCLSWIVTFSHNFRSRLINTCTDNLKRKKNSLNVLDLYKYWTLISKECEIRIWLPQMMIKRDRDYVRCACSLILPPLSDPLFLVADHWSYWPGKFDLCWPLLTLAVRVSYLSSLNRYLLP